MTNRRGTTVYLFLMAAVIILFFAGVIIAYFQVIRKTTEDNIVNMAACIFDNIERLERGETPVGRCIVNKQYLKA